MRDYLGWSHVLDNADELDLPRTRRTRPTDKKRQADETVNSRLLGAYHWALVPEAPEPGSPFVITATKAEGQSTSLAERVSKRLGADGALATQQAAAAIRLWLNRLPKLWEDGHVKVGDLWHQYTTYPYMPRLRDRSVLARGVADQPLLWQQDGFALALSYDGERYEGLTLPSEGEFGQVTDSMLLVKPEVALAQRQRETPAEPGPGLGLAPNRSQRLIRFRAHARSRTRPYARTEAAQGRLLLWEQDPRLDALCAGLQEADGRSDPAPGRVARGQPEGPRRNRG